MEKNKYKRIFPIGKRCKDNTKKDNQQIDCKLIVPVAGTLLETKKIGQRSCISGYTEAI